MKVEREFRYVWRDILMGPAGRKLSGTKLSVAYWISNHIHAGRVSCYPAMKTLVKVTGRGRSTLFEAIAALEYDQWLGSIEGMEALVHRWMTIPPQVLSDLDDEILAQYKRYLQEVADKYPTAGVQETGHKESDERSRKLDGGSPESWTVGVQPSDERRPESCTIRRTIKELRPQPEREQQNSAAVALARPIAPPVAIHAEDGLRPPDFKTQALWKDRWPDESILVPRYTTIESCRTMIGVWSTRVLGYGDLPPPQVDGVYLDRVISTTMEPALLDRLANEMQGGRLTELTLARALASMGYAPADIAVAAKEAAL